MKKFINTVSIITAAVVTIYDIGTLWLTSSVIIKLAKEPSGKGYIFLIMLVFAVFIAIKITVEQIKTGIEFKENECEFNGLDSDNIFKYSEITKVTIEKDEKVSFIKNLSDKSGFINLEMNDGKIHVINLGTISRKKLIMIKKQIEMRKNGIQN